MPAPWIQAIQLANVRGVGAGFTLEFEKSSTPPSLILYGDNGTGKSSICDGIEKAILGYVSKARHGIRQPLLFHAFSTRPLLSEVTFSDGSRARVGEQSPEIRPRKSRREISPDWVGQGRIPFVLRRGEVLNFLTLAPDQRFVALLQYLPQAPPGPDAGDEYTRSVLAPAERAFSDWTRRRNELASELCKVVGIPLPAELAEIHSMKFNLDELRARGVNFDHMRQVQREFQKSFAERKRAKKRYNELFRARPAGATPEAHEQIQGLLAEISGTITKFFLDAQSPVVVENLRLELGHGKESRIQFVATVPGHDDVAPEEILSEANLDLLGVVTFLSIVQRTIPRGQPRVLVLDDVLHSVDGPHRIAVAKIVARYFKGWQLIVTTHDRLWAKQLDDVLRSEGHKTQRIDLLPWSRRHGTRVGDARDLVGQLRDAVIEGNALVAGALSGPSLEYILGNMSWRLEASVIRRANDLYTIGDLWPSVRARLKSSSLSQTLERLNDYLMVRNLTGAHYNEWAQSLSDQEVLTFAAQVVALHAGLSCPACSEWVSARRSESFASCKCGATELEL